MEEHVKNKMLEDTAHWQNVAPPLAPNEYEIEIYKHHIRGYGPICLLGMTKDLQPLCDFMVDANPIKQTKPVIKNDWFCLKNEAEVFIGDGVINLTSLDLVKKLLRIGNKVVCRVFLKKLDGMKYATYFPNEFPGASLVIPTQENIAMVVWEN